MFETPMTAVGRIITDLRRRVVGDQEVISFRMACNSRRRTAEGAWEPGNTLYITVNCWGRLVTGVGAGLYKGAPVIATGTVHTSEYDDKDGIKRSSLEMRANAVGPDLSKVIIRIEQPPQQQHSGSAEPEEDPADEASRDDAMEDAEGLVLSA